MASRAMVLNPRLWILDPWRDLAFFVLAPLWIIPLVWWAKARFDIDSVGYRENSLHKLDTLIAALRVFREALVKEFAPYDQRGRALGALEEHQDEPPGGAAPRPSRPT